MKNQRIEYYDFLRGLAIIMVVGIHTFTPTSLETFDGVSSAFFRQLLNCAVPIFLALSGFFLSRKNLDSKTEIISFWQKQIPKVYIPGLIWSVPILFSKIFFSNQSIDGFFIFKNVVLLLICGYSIYYFLALIIQFYILLPLLQKYKTIMMPISIIVSFISITAITYIQICQGISLPLIIYAGPFISWFMFFMLGVYLSSQQTKYSLSYAVILTIAGFILECVEAYFLNTKFGGGLGIKISSFIFSFGVILIALFPKVSAMYSKNTLTNIIAKIGSISFGIYLIHCFVIQLISHIISLNNWVILWFIVLIATSLIIIIANKILPYKFSNT